VRILYVLGALQHPSIVRGALRHYQFLRRLGRRHSITLLVLSREAALPRAVDELRSMVGRLEVIEIDAAGLMSQPGSGGMRVRRKLRQRAAVRTMRARVHELLAEETFDVVLFHGKAAAPVLEGIRDVPIVIDICDATSLRQREQLRHAPLLQVPWRIAGYVSARVTERRLVRTSSHVAFISPRDREAVQGAASSAAILPNGIDLDYWRPSGGERHENTILFTGVMSYAPNEDAALFLIEAVMPLLRQSRADVRLQIVGLDPSPRLLAAAAGNPAVEVTGYVDDLRPYLDTATVYAAPIRYASGIQNKILEAMAMGIPVVTTRVVADGLRVAAAAPPVHVAAASDQFAAAVLALLQDADDRDDLAARARSYVSGNFDWDRTTDVLEGLCRQALRCSPAFQEKRRSHVASMES
jgi:polysaccharide biosynthesis protein PslH